MNPWCPKLHTGDKYTGESCLTGGYYIRESRLPCDDYTGEARLPGLFGASIKLNYQCFLQSNFC
jgi:hypothetical protein